MFKIHGRYNYDISTIEYIKSESTPTFKLICKLRSSKFQVAPSLDFPKLSVDSVISFLILTCFYV